VPLAELGVGRCEGSVEQLLAQRARKLWAETKGSLAMEKLVRRHERRRFRPNARLVRIAFGPAPDVRSIRRGLASFAEKPRGELGGTGKG